MIKSRKVDKPLILYGYGKLGHLAEEIFKELKIPIYALFDSKIPHTQVLDGGDERNKKGVLVAVCVATESCTEIVKRLQRYGFSDIASVWDIIEAYPEIGIHNGWFVGETTDEDEEGVVFLHDNFKDRYSQWHYLQFRKWHENREEWLSVNYLIDTAQPSLPSTLADIRARQKVIYWSDSHHTFWNSYGDSGTVYIHQEGRELETLEANIEIFQKRRPKIDVACYHSRDGLWKIEKFLMDNLPDYTWTFRLHAYMGQGSYIYGIPNERKGE